MKSQKKNRKKKRSGVYGLLMFMIIVLAGAVVVVLTTDVDQRIMTLLNPAEPEPAAVDSEPEPQPILTQLDAPEPESTPDPEPEPVKPQPEPRPAADVAPVDIIPARPAVDTEAMRLAELDRQSRALFLLSDNYYKMRSFDMAIAKLQDVIALGHPDWTQQANDRIAFIKSVQTGE
jgi:hypothetical protein